MRGLPDVQVAGSLTADPSLRYTPNGRAVANFTVIANERRYDRERQEYVDGDKAPLRCVVWGAAAENLAESATRGDRLVVQGSLRQTSWNDRESGQTRYGWELDVHEVAVSLQYAIAKVTRAARSSSSSTVSNANDRHSDPWASAPVSGSGATSDEPPY